jgi:hypothetical protein
VLNCAFSGKANLSSKEVDGVTNLTTTLLQQKIFLKGDVLSDDLRFAKS